MHYLVYNLSRVQIPLLPPEALDAAEQESYAKRGKSYLLERTLLRREIERLTGTPASSIRLTYSANGKPEYPPCPFNLSHSGELLCLAFHQTAVGVDIERMRPRTRLLSLARRIMCPEQLQAWQERGCPEQEFYSCWCAAEALIKLYGATIWQAQDYPFLYHPGSIQPLFEHAPSVQLITPAAAYAGAVAYFPGSSEA